MNKALTFAGNLKQYRQKLGLTQKQLAQQLDYTEKTVSKWENGNGLPTLEMLVKLAELFGISLDELVFSENAGPCFLGIDGGGTKTMFKLVDENDTVLREICKGSSNPNDIGMENAEQVLAEGIREVCNGISYANVTMFAGLSGGGMSGDNVSRLNQFFQKFGFFAFENGSDIENLVALAPFEKCILVIMGTGFITYVLDGPNRKRIAGWGQFFDDGGSGYTLGKDAITAVLAAGDGSGAPTLLTKLMQERLGETAEQHLARFYQGGKKYIAGFADLVFSAAQQGDAVAKGILEKNMAYVAEKISAGGRVLDCESVPVLISGGLGAKCDLLFSMIEKCLTGKVFRLMRIEQAPVEGAVKRAKTVFESKMK